MRSSTSDMPSNTWPTNMPTRAAWSPPKIPASLVFRQFTPGTPIRLVAYGDMRFTNPSVTSGTNPRVRKFLADKIAAEHPRAVLLTGDMPYTGADPADWKVFQDETRPWRDE